MTRLYSVLLMILLLQGCGVTYRLTKVDSSEPTPGRHEVAPSYQIQYLSCDHRSWFASNGPRPNLNPADELATASSMLIQPPEHIAAAKQGYQFALMSSNVYRDSDRFFVLPGWKLVKREESPSGLSVDVLIQGDPDSPVRVATVFRGTDGFNLADWRANLSIWFEPAQYFEAQRFFENHVLKDPKFEHSSLFVAGHSLGGGIALNVSLRWSTPHRPVTAFAFNSSPRGFYTPYNDTRTASRTILSENAEFLSFFRKIWSTKLETVEERKYNFQKFSNPLNAPLGEHKIYNLSRALLMLALAYGEPSARETFRANFSMSSVRDQLQRKGLSESQLRKELELCQVHLN